MSRIGKESWSFCFSRLDDCHFNYGKGKEYVAETSRKEVSR
jgi:hypothetical protein